VGTEGLINPTGVEAFLTQVDAQPGEDVLSPPQMDWPLFEVVPTPNP
jgi:hypothetical protein